MLAKDLAKERQEMEDEADQLVQSGKHIEANPELIWHNGNEQRPRQ
jgi:hypothetical protein